MAMINPDCLKLTLNEIRKARALVLCSIEDPVKYESDVMANALAVTGVTFGEPESTEDENGLQIQVTVQSGEVGKDSIRSQDLDIPDTGLTAKSWVLVSTTMDNADHIVYATGYLQNQQMMYKGNTFSLGNFYVGIGNI